VDVAQLVELLVVVQAVAGSNPVVHPLGNRAVARLLTIETDISFSIGRQFGIAGLQNRHFRFESWLPDLPPVAIAWDE
jgi:hypothetical protein